MDDLSVKREHKRLENLLDKANVPQEYRDTLAPIIDNLAWMRIKLDETRELMMSTNVVCKYNNGGGQAGWRENPIFKGYNNLLRSYLTAFEKFSSYLPEEIETEIEEPESILEKVKAMKKAK